MIIPRLAILRRKPGIHSGRMDAEAIFRRFFALIGRLERPVRPAGFAAPEIKARITRLDDEQPHRPN